MPWAHRPGAPRSLRASRPARRPQRRVRVEDPVGQALEEVRLVGVDPEVMELDLGLRPGQGRGPLEGGRLAVLVGEVEHLLARLGDDRGEDRVDGRAGREADPAAEAEDRVEHRADGVRQRTSVDHRDRRADRAAAAEEAGSVGLVLDDRRRPAPRRPRRAPPRSAARRSTAAGASPAARRCSATNSVCTNRFWKAGWATSAACGARTISAYDVSSISRALRAEVGQRDPADLGVVLGRDDDRQAGRDRAVAPGELGVVLGVGDLVAVGLGAARLVAGRPDRAACACRAGRGSCPTGRGSRPRASGSPPGRASGCSRIRPPSPSPRSGRSTAGASAGSRRAAR